MADRDSVIPYSVISIWISVKKWNPIFVVAAACVLAVCAGVAVAAAPSDKGQASEAAGCIAALDSCGIKASSRISAHFIVVTGDDAETALTTATALEAAYAGFFKDLLANGLVARQTDRLMTWVVFEDGEEMDEYAEVADHADTTRLDGYYSPRTNCVAIVKTACDQSRDWEEKTASSGNGTVLGAAGEGSQGHFRRISHEAAHQLSFNCGMLTRGVMYPLWVSEGVSTNFECDGPDAMHFCGPNKPRAERLAGLVGEGKLMPLARLIRLVQVPPCPAAAQDDYYAQAWGLFNFLYNHHRAELKTYLANMSRQRLGYRDGETLAAEFKRAFGDAAAMETEWKDFAAQK